MAMAREELWMKSRRNLLRFLSVVTAAGLLFFSCPGSVKEPPVITIAAQPAPETNVTAGSISGDLTVTAGVTHNAALSYQWQQSSQIDFAGNTNTGTNDPVLAIPAGLTAGTYYFRCIVSAKGAKSQKSDTAAVNVAARIPEITITAQPATVTNITVGGISENLSISAVVTPGGNLNYQWQQSDMSDFAGKTNVGSNDPALAIPAGLVAGTYYYRCVVSAEGAKSETSNTATVIVAAQISKIAITTQPAPVTNVTAGSISENLSVSALVTPDAPLYYQWYCNTFADNTGGSVISGATLSYYTLPPTLLPGTYYYFCEMASVGAASVHSTVAAVTVTSLVEMVLVPAGLFVMGKDLGTVTAGDVTPVSTVTLTYFHIGKYPVTQAQYQSVIRTNPSYFIAANAGPPAAGEAEKNRPVEQVSWYDALVFCNTLSIREGLTPAYSIYGSTNPVAWGTVPTAANSAWDAVVLVIGSTGYRLPTEAQWEYAAKGGDGSPGSYTYSGSNNVDDVAWYVDNSGSKTHEAGKKKANGLGIYDMSGNVSEWCWDWYGSYTSTIKTDPMGVSVGSNRVIRGGYYSNDAVKVRSVYRYNSNPYSRFYLIGFRVCRP